MPDTQDDHVAAPAPTRFDTLTYIVELLQEQRRMAQALGYPLLAHLIGVSALEAEESAAKASKAERVGLV